MTQKKEGAKKTSFKFLTIIICLIFMLGAIGYYYSKNMLPEQILNQGKKYFETNDYNMALKFFEKAVNTNPGENEPLYYEALTLSKMPSTYEVQKKLYEIAQMEDVDEASSLAEKVILEMRKNIDREAGSNYADNILFNDVLIRWNNKEPITYTILGDSSIPQEYYNTIKLAFQKWQEASNGIINFKEALSSKDAKIVINLVDDVSTKDNNDPNSCGRTDPIINNGHLEKMNVFIKKTDSTGNNYGNTKLLEIAEHEIGHAIGLGGHSSNPQDMMNYTGHYIEDRNKEITQRDINTLRLLYKMVPDVIDKEIPESEYNNYLYHNFITMYPGEDFELEVNRLISELQNDRQNIVSWVDLAINYAEKKQYSRSNHILLSILPLSQNNVQNQQIILYNIAVNYYKMRNYDSASKYLSLAQTLKTDKDTQILEAFIDVKKGRIELAEKKLKLLKEKYPANIEISLKLADIYYANKDKDKLKEVIESLIKNNPKAAFERRIKKYRK